MVFEHKTFVGSDDRAFVELRELNRQIFDLMREQSCSAAASAPAPPIFVSLRDQWQALRGDSIARAAAACPCLMADFGFLDARRWSAVANDQVQDQERLPYFFDVPAAQAVARAVLTEAWHYARTHGVLLGLFGIPGRVAQIIESCSQTQILLLAERNSDWLQPRWPMRLWFWEGLLKAAIDGNETALRRSGSQATSLLAAEMIHGMRL